MRTVIHFLLATSLLLTASAVAGDTLFQSGPQQAHLLELFTSEGCSSCPPAEERLSNLQSDPRLWKQIVPVAFHVDYWDNLGWPDRFASHAFTRRQMEYASEWGSGSVYTPEFVLDGKEFRGGEIGGADDSAGTLTAKLKSTGELTIHYEAPPHAASATWAAHIATLGMDIETDVRGGENGGRRLRHDFVVLFLTSQPLDSSGNTVSLKLPPAENSGKAIAIWVTRAGSSTPFQAAGGWLR